MMMLRRTMLKLVAVLGVAFVCSGPLAHAQSTYYVDPQGDDSRDGKTPSTAWRTVQKVNATSFSPGDRILFRRGGVWSQELDPSSSGNSSARITYADYGAGAKPIIDAGGALNGWNQAGNWSDQGGNIWTFNTSTFPGRVWLDGREYGTSGDNTGRGSTTPDARYRWWHDGNNTLKLYSTGNPATTYKSIEVANQGRNAMSINGRSYLTFQNMEFRRGGESCIDVYNGDNLILDSCKVLAGTAKYGLWLRGGSDNGIARYCNFDREDTIMHTFEYGGNPDHANGADNIALQWANGWDFHHNTIMDPGHDAISLSGQDNGGEIWRSCFNKIHDNEVGMKGDYGRFTSTNAIDSVGYCAYNDFYRNHIVNMATQSQILGMYNRMYYNVFENQRVIPWDKAADNTRSVAVELSDYLSAMPLHNVLWNNTFKGGQATAIRVCKGQSYASVKNNLIYNMGQDPTPGNYITNVGMTLWTGFSTDTIANNLVYCVGANPVIYNQADWSPNTPISVSALNSNNGSNGNVITSNIGADPRFNNDLTVAATSPTKDAGVSVGLAADFYGNPIVGKPDIGAIEQGALTTTDVADQPQTTTHPGSFALDQNYPNPFNPSTVIRYSIVKEGHVTLEIYNVVGQRVAVLVDEVRPAGVHQVTFTAEHLASGVYIYRLAAAGQSPLVKKMTVVK